MFPAVEKEMKNIRLFLLKILLLLMVICSGPAMGRYEQLDMPFSVIQRAEFDKMFDEHLRGCKSTANASEISLHAMREIVWLIVAVLSDSTRGYSVFGESIYKRLTTCLLRLRMVLSPDEWQQEHYNAFLLAYELTYEFLEKEKDMGQGYVFSSHSVLRNALERGQITNEKLNKCYESEFVPSHWGDSRKYDEEKLDNARNIAKEYIRIFDLIGLLDKNKERIFKSDETEIYAEIGSIPEYGETFLIDPTDAGEEIKQAALRDPTPERVGQLVSLIHNQNDRKKKKSAIRVLKILAYFDGNETARKAMYDFGLWRGIYVPLGRDKVCESISDYLSREQEIIEKNDEADLKLEEEFKKFKMAPLNMSGLQLRTGNDGNLRFSGMANTTESAKFCVQLPNRIDNLGKHLAAGFTFNSINSNAAWFGWKLHISARPENAVLITKLVIPILEKYGVHYKIICTLPLMRWRYNWFRYNSGSVFSQIGKFITVYPNNDRQANAIATEINMAFENACLTPEDFIPILGDFQIGTTGGIFTRPCHYGDSFRDSREVP
jgi:hypothetical protein